MPTKLSIDEKLLAEAHAMGGCATEEETIAEALKEFIARCKRKQVLGAFGKLEMDSQYDYRKDRRRS